jgi:hypothetical protein
MYIKWQYKWIGNKFVCLCVVIFPPLLTFECLSLLSLLFCPAEHFLITTLHGPHRKHSLYCSSGVFTEPLPTNRRPIVASVCLRGNVFTESLPNNGYTRHSKCSKTAY